MRVPLLWLRSYCEPPLDAAGIGERLDLTGTELERIERVGVGSTEGFVVGRVLDCSRHPDADRLSVCSVDDGSGSPRTIVCGAPNVAAGQTVAVALPGAVMPDGTVLGEAKLRGVASSGMILAEDEVGIGPDHGGTMVLPSGLAPGSPLAEAFPIADEVLELEITPNRPDCLSVWGIAREVHAATGAALHHEALDEPEPTATGRASDRVSIEIADPAVCRRFTGRVFEGVRVGPSPPWLKQRLVAAGQRPISNVVDITNYVMLATGQPLHAFDLDRVRGGRIIVRAAEPGERMTTLDDAERVLDPDVVVVADAEGPSGLAGIMGGQVSEVTQSTTRVLMEAATWVPTRVLRTSKALGLRSEASTRFEKGLHPEHALDGQRLAARLMVELCGAELVPETIDVYPVAEPARTLTLRLDRLERLLGERIPDGDVVGALQAIGFGVEGAGSGELAVTVPYWRDADVQREADLVEEVARIHGLEQLPVTLPSRERAVGRLTHAQRLRRRLEDALRDRGLDEIVAWSFTSAAALDRLRIGDEPALALANPLSEDQSVMRPLLLPGLLDAAQHNLARGSGGLALFESAHAYRPDGPLDAPRDSPRGATPAIERQHLAGLLTEARPATWRGPAAPADFFAAKGLVEALGAAAGVELAFERAARPFLHPGRSAVVRLASRGASGSDGGSTPGGGRELGWIGELHPLVAGAWDLEGAACFELDADALAEAVAGAIPAYRDVTTFPAVRQDIAVVAPAGATAAEVEAAVRRGGGDLLASIAVFDVFEGEQVGEGNRSLALALEFRVPDRTLTDEEVAQRRAAIEKALGGIGGRLRGGEAGAADGGLADG